MALAFLLPKRFPNFFELTAATSIGLALRYTFLAGTAWLIGYVFFQRRWIHRKIIARTPATSEVWREVRFSALSLFVFGVVGAATGLAAHAGWTQLYWRIGAHGWTWFALSIVCTIVLHDTWFYWTHRLMHRPRLFRFFHRVHHLSHNPSPWAAYSFSVPEAFVQAAIFPLAVLVMPIHPLAFVIFMGWQLGFNVAGHAGFEIYPRWLMDSPLGWVLNTPTNHIMHHESLRGNYGLYFNVWDRVMGTNHADYERRFREVTSRPRIADVPAEAVRGSAGSIAS